MNKNTFAVGFMLFAIFFGAGNLIFPPILGHYSGTDFLPAIIGFVATGVGLPILGIIISINYKNGYQGALTKIHPIISLVFLVVVYLAIGPFFAIPRTAATAFDMAIVPVIGGTDAPSLLAFTIIYFGVALWLSLNPHKMVDRIGQILTPALLIAIVALVAGVLVMFTGQTFELKSPSYESPLLKGFLEGYQTLDALASFAFAVVVIKAIRERSESNETLKKQATIAALIAAVALAVIYVAIGWIGNALPIDVPTLEQVNASGQNLGTFILNQVATDAFGSLGRIVLGTIVTLACLTTTIGLIVATSQYFNSIFPKISYPVLAITLSVVGLVLANQGLNAIISRTVPVLLILYPIAMTIMLLLAVNLVVCVSRLFQGITIITVAVESILAVSGFDIIQSLPFSASSMEWVVFALSGTILGIVHQQVKAKTE